MMLSAPPSPDSTGDPGEDLAAEARHEPGGHSAPAGAPAHSLGAFIRAALRERLRELRQAAADFERTAGAEELHELRVGLRSLRSVVQTLREVLGREPVEGIVEQIKAIADRTNRLRDAEVLTAWLRQARAPEPDRPWLAAWLERHLGEEERTRRELHDEFQRLSLEPSLARLEALLAGAAPAEFEGAPHRFAEKAVASRRKRLVRRLRDLPELIGDDGALHAARIAAKRLRYVTEFYAPLLSNGHRKYARAARELQGRLGDLHDLDVFLVGLAARQVEGESVPPALIQHLLADRAGKALQVPALVAKALRRLA